MVGRYNAIEGTIKVLRWYDHSTVFITRFACIGGFLVLIFLSQMTEIDRATMKT